MKVPDTSAAQHLKARGFDQLSTTLKGKLGDHPISDLVYTFLSQIPMETSIVLDKAEKFRKNMIPGATEPKTYLV